MSSQHQRRLDYDWDFQEEAQAVHERPKFHDYHETTTSNKARLEELIFFSQLAIFSVATVAFAFLFLAFQFPALLAMVLAMALAGGCTFLLKEIIF